MNRNVFSKKAKSLLKVTNSDEQKDDEEGSRWSGLVDSPGRIDRIANSTVLVDAVVSILNGLNDSESTHTLMLYFLRVMDNPAILECDVRFIQMAEALKRKIRDTKQKASKYGLALISLALGTIFMNLLTLFGF